MKRTTVFIIVYFITLLLLVTSLPAQVNIPGGVRAVSDGNGTIHLFWYPAKGVWPQGGFRILDQNGSILIERILPLQNISTDNSLSSQDTIFLQKLAKDPTVLSSTRAEDVRKYQLALVLKTAISPAIAKALGLSCQIKANGKGKQSYTVVGLDNGGRPGTMNMKSAPIDASMPSPLPPAPKKIWAQMSPIGVEIFWEKPKDKENEVVYFEIERSNSGSEFLKITDKPLLVSTANKSTQIVPQFIDETAPQEQEVNYRLMGVDLFGRRSLAIETKLFVPTFATLMPPNGIKIEANGKGIQLNWPAGQHPATTRYLIERSLMAGGPFIAITPDGIKASQQQYRDDNLTNGGTYYYRLRTATSEGQLSHPSEVVSAQLLFGDPPAMVRGLAANLGISSVRLSWQAGDRSIAGYLIERQIGRDWQRINETVWADTEYEYRYRADQQLTMVFRVRAVGYGNQIGTPSEPLTIQINKMPVGIPEILKALSTKDGVLIEFTFPQERKDLQFVVRRAGKEKEEGLPISTVLTSKTMHFTDVNVSPGNRYFYRIQAFTASGWKSELSNAVSVSIHASELPVPAKPTAKFETKPFTHVKITFSKVPPNLRVIVERKTIAEAYWTTLKGEGLDDSFIDANPPKDKEISYRLRFMATDLVLGNPSEAITITHK